VSVQRHASRKKDATHYFFFSFFFEEKKTQKQRKPFLPLYTREREKRRPRSAQLSIQISQNKRINKFPVLPYTRSHQKFPPFLYCVSSIKKPLAKSRLATSERARFEREEERGKEGKTKPSFIFEDAFTFLSHQR